MAKLAIRVTSDRKTRETVVTGDNDITVDILQGNSIVQRIQIHDNLKGEILYQLSELHFKMWHIKNRMVTYYNIEK